MWSRRVDELHTLLATVTRLYAALEALLAAGREAAAAGGGDGGDDTLSSRETVLEFILSTLVTPRTVSAILHAAKKL
eukprot:93588-Chlamydomonas_euryale.AAC.1